MVVKADGFFYFDQRYFWPEAMLKKIVRGRDRRFQLKELYSFLAIVALYNLFLVYLYLALSWQCLSYSTPKSYL